MLLEVLEDRNQWHSTIVTSQIPIAQLHATLGDPTLADAIMDRLTHNAHRIELRGESLRRRRDHPTKAAPSAARDAEPAEDAEAVAAERVVAAR